jgi:hypothetical protein
MKLRMIVVSPKPPRLEGLMEPRRMVVLARPLILRLLMESRRLEADQFADTSDRVAEIEMLAIGQWQGVERGARYKFSRFEGDVVYPSPVWDWMPLVLSRAFRSTYQQLSDLTLCSDSPHTGRS